MNTELINGVKELGSEENLYEVLRKEPYHFNIKTTDRLYLVNSTKKSEEKYSLVTGLIFEKDTNKVVCYGIDTCIDVDEIDKESSEYKDSLWTVEECYDSTMLKMYYYDGEWQLATTNCINAQTSWWSTPKSFDTLFRESITIDYNGLNKDYCYTFVLQHPSNQLVILVDRPYVYHVGTRSLIANDNYREIEDDIVYCFNERGERCEVLRPKVISEGSKIEDVKIMMEERTANGSYVRGYMLKRVLETGSVKRVKMDTNIYKDMANIRGNTQSLSIRYLQLINSDGDRQKLRNYYPMFRQHFDTIEASLLAISSTIQNEYYHKYIKKEYKRMYNPRYEQTLRQLHGQYKRTRELTTNEVVYAKLKTYNYKILGYIMNWW